MNLYKSISSFNRLNGKLVSRSTVRSRLRKIATNKELAASTQGKKMVEILNKILTQMPEAGSARIYFDPIPPAYGLAGTKQPIEPALGNPAPPTNGQPDSLFVRADQAPPQPEDVFTLPGPIGKLLGKLQRYKLAIALHGDYHGGKSEFSMQLIDAFADRGMRVGLFDLEQGGLYSKDTLTSIKRNIKPGNRSRLAVAAEAPGGLDEIKRYADKFDVIVIDSWQKLGFITNEKFDELRKEYPNTIWVVIFQQNAAGEVRGGAAANYDAPVVLRAVRADRYDFSRNYIEVKKNRGNPTDRWYMIAAKRVVNNIPEHKPEKDGNSTS